METILDVILPLLTIVAIVAGPVAALLVSRRLDEEKAKKDRKLGIFKTLIATRGGREQGASFWQSLSFEHVRALNCIVLEFDEKEVLDAWREYHDFLYDENLAKLGENAEWLVMQKAQQRKLLLIMGEKLGYKKRLNEVDIKNLFYIPSAHAYREQQERDTRRFALEVLEGKRPIHFAHSNSIPPPNTKYTGINNQ